MARKNIKPRIWKLVRMLAIFIGIMIAIPLALVPIYWIVNPPSTNMIVRKIINRPVTRIWQPIDQISDRLKASVIMSEDGQFCSHHGVDLGALRAEFEQMLAGRSPRGASTITMQVARNLFLWNGRNIVRKGLEIPLAIYIDLVLSKRRIMEIYLNIAEWGPNGEFGIEAASQHTFGSGSNAFSWQNAALMAVTLPNPIVRNPARPNPGLQRVADIVERRARNGSAYISCLYKETKNTSQ